jgi:putative glutamine amidotransferase
MRPVIGITCTSTGSDNSSHGIGVTYISSVEHASGTPILLPLIQSDSCIEDFLGLMDGLLLSGGVDVDPFLYGEESQPKMGTINVDKDRVEMILASRALEMDMPILAICRGIQMLNVAAGGTLYQDMSMISNAVLKHRQDAPRWYGTHTIHVQEGSRLMDILGHSTVRVNTFHHQAVKDTAPGFVVSAVTSDGVIEGIESTRHTFAVGVQCHPEGMWQNNPTIANLFVAFVKAAKAYKQQ